MMKNIAVMLVTVLFIVEAAHATRLNLYNDLPHTIELQALGITKTGIQSTSGGGMNEFWNENNAKPGEKWRAIIAPGSSDYIDLQGGINGLMVTSSPTKIKFVGSLNEEYNPNNLFRNGIYENGITLSIPNRLIVPAGATWNITIK